MYIYIYKVWTAGIALAGLMMMTMAACGESQFAPEPEQTEEESRKVSVTLLARQPGEGGDEEGKPDTRLSYTDAIEEDGIIKVKWEAGDKLRVFTFKNSDGDLNEEGEMTTNGVADENGMVTFTGEITPGYDNNIHCLYIGESLKSNKPLPNFEWYFPTGAIIQDCDNPTKHLKNMDLLYAVSEDGSPLSFTGRGTAMFRFEVNLPEGTSKSIELIKLEGDREGNDPFSTKVTAEFYLGGWDGFKGGGTGRELTISLTNDPVDDKVTAYIMIPIKDGHGYEEKYTLKVTAEDNTTYQSEFTLDPRPKNKGGCWNPGVCYTIKQDVQELKPAN